MPNPIMIPADPAPALAKGFSNIADIFAPPSARDAYYGTEAGLAKAKTQAEAAKAMRLSDLWSARDTMTPDQFDRATAAIGLNSVTQGYAKLDVDKRGQDITSADNRNKVAVEASTSIANNTANNDRATLDTIMKDIPEGATVIRPPSVVAKYGVPAQSNGIVKLNPGQTATLPPGPAGAGSPADAGVPAPTVLQGNPQVLTKEQVEGQNLKDAIMRNPGLGTAVAEGAVPARPVYGTPSGTAYQDPVDKSLKNTQDKTPLAPGTKATNLGAPTTTINNGPNGEPFGAPPAGMAWARNTDGTVQLDDRGAPKALVIGGTPLADKQAKAATAQGEAEKARAQTSNIVTQDIDRAIAAIEADPTLTTGLGSQITGGVGGTPGHNVRSLIASVKANVSFDRLQQMRAASPTGGALGNVSNTEGTKLESVLGSLEQSQGAEQLKENLKRVKDVTLDIVHGPGNGPARSNEQTAVNKQTGARAIYRGGQWVPE